MKLAMQYVVFYSMELVLAVFGTMFFFAPYKVHKIIAWLNRGPWPEEPLFENPAKKKNSAITLRIIGGVFIVFIFLSICFVQIGE